MSFSVSYFFPSPNYTGRLWHVQVRLNNGPFNITIAISVHLRRSKPVKCQRKRWIVSTAILMFKVPANPQG